MDSSKDILLTSYAFPGEESRDTGIQCLNQFKSALASEQRKPRIVSSLDDALDKLCPWEVLLIHCRENDSSKVNCIGNVSDEEILGKYVDPVLEKLRERFDNFASMFLVYNLAAPVPLANEAGIAAFYQSPDQFSNDEFTEKYEALERNLFQIFPGY